MAKPSIDLTGTEKRWAAEFVREGVQLVSMGTVTAATPITKVGGMTDEIEPKVAYRTSEGRPIYECVRCAREFSARAWLVKSPECAAMCQTCEETVSAAASLLGLQRMAETILKGERYRAEAIKGYAGPLYHAKLDCDHEIIHAGGGGVKCRKCEGWFCA